MVEDHGLVTGGGVSLAIDATLYLIDASTARRRDAVAEVIEYDRAYRANEAALGHLRVVPAAPEARQTLLSHHRRGETPKTAGQSWPTLARCLPIQDLAPCRPSRF